MTNTKQIAVVIFGPPGAGKGTQAQLLADKLSLERIDTGTYIKEVVHDPANADNPEIQEERKKYDSGLLVSPSWALRLVSKYAKDYAVNGKSIIFSGSPRTMDEAKGMDGALGLIEVLEGAFGKDNVKVFQVILKHESSIERNSNRLICKKTGEPVRSADECDGEVEKRSDDKPEVIKDRIVEYETRTFPVIQEFKDQGYTVNEIDGEPSIEDVHEQIMQHFG